MGMSEWLKSLNYVIHCHGSYAMVLMFFLWRARISFRPRITKKQHVFFLLARIGLLLISETTSLFQEMKKHFFLAVFVVAIITFFKIDKNIVFTVFPPSLIRCWIFYDIKREIKQCGL